MNLTRKQASQLIKGCVHNDRTAQEALYKLYYADMLRVCNNYLPDKELAKEAFNAGFLKIFQSIQNYDPAVGELGGWMRKIMIFTSIDLCRRELKFNPNNAQIAELDEGFALPAVLDKLYFEDILRHIRKLPYTAQTVFNLSVIDGFSHREISEQLNISEGTSRWYLSEAKKQLRALLETSGIDPLKERRGERK